VSNVPDAGLAGKKNGELLSLAKQAGYEVFVTVDRGIEYEQNLASGDIAVVVLRAKSSRLADLLPLVPEILRLLPSVRSGEITTVGA
jgi:hypothetical protein